MSCAGGLTGECFKLILIMPYPTWSFESLQDWDCFISIELAVSRGKLKEFNGNDFA